MQSPALPLHLYDPMRRAATLRAAPLLLAVLLSLILWGLFPHGAEARAIVRRDRRADREVSVPYQTRRAPLRQNSGYVISDRRSSAENTSPRSESAKSAESTQTLSNKNDENTATRDTKLRVIR